MIVAILYQPFEACYLAISSWMVFNVIELGDIGLAVLVPK
jgi:hypothetical protein